MPRRNYKALLIALAIYIGLSPLSTYNTLAMFGVVQSRYVPLQLSITAVMIVFAFIAGGPLGKHCLADKQRHPVERWLWTGGFYILGPPILFAYYRLRFIRSVQETA
jgi:hypothetical protein